MGCGASATPKVFDESEMDCIKQVPAVRTSQTPAAPPQEALKLLKEGNQRYVSARRVIDHKSLAEHRKQFVAHGQKPLAAVFGCADSRAPVEAIFDAIPGDLFILRNAGNTCSRAEGSMVGSLEYAVGHLDTKLILVLGHTKCGAVCGAVKTMLAQKEAMTCEECAPAKIDKGQSALQIMLGGIVPVAMQAADELPGATEDQIAVKAIQLNVFHTMQRLFQYSETVRKMVKMGEIEVHGGIYDLESGKVQFLGPHPKEASLIDSHLEVAEIHDCLHDETTTGGPSSGNSNSS